MWLAGALTVHQHRCNLITFWQCIGGDTAQREFMRHAQFREYIFGTGAGERGAGLANILFYLLTKVLRLQLKQNHYL